MNKTIKFLALTCFGLIAVWDVVNFAQSLIQINYFDFWALLTTIGSIFIVVAIASSLPALSACGFAFWVIDSIRIVGSLCAWIADEPSNILSVIWLLASMVAYIILIIASLKPDSAKSLSLVAFIAAVIRFVLLIISGILVGHVYISGVLWSILFIVGAYSLGNVYSITNQTTAKKVVAATNRNNSQGTDIEYTEKLTKLKSLLDGGVITQEEFDAKKKEILNMLSN